MNATTISIRKLSGIMDYRTYLDITTQLLAQGKTSGTTQSEALTNYTKLNLQRMKRLHKTTHLMEELSAVLEHITTPQTWIVLTESWCGDASQIIPVLDVVAKSTPMVELKLLFRDEHLDLMDQFLTNGGRSIPKLVITESETGNVLADWGPRPAEIQEQVMTYKANPHVPFEEFVVEVQNWYNKDKTRQIQLELANLLNGLK
ncbi:MAG: thioredoxin family protein [Bacteroidota bacterium]